MTATDPTARDVVVVTRFECGTFVCLVTLALLHPWIRHQVEVNATGILGACRRILWRERTLLSVSLWRDVESIYSMGSCQRHISAARLPARLGIETSCAIFNLSGDWKRIMFNSPARTRSPLRPLKGLSRSHAGRMTHEEVE